jgi:hypothetical protein
MAAPPASPIVFRKQTLAERFLLLMPSRRRASEERLGQAIAALDDPTLPCVIEGRVIPDGFGSFIEPPR